MYAHEHRRRSSALINLPRSLGTRRHTQTHTYTHTHTHTHLHCPASLLSCLPPLQGVAEVIIPRAGMFMWLKFTTIPDFDDVATAEFVAQRIVGVPGRLFWSDVEKVSGREEEEEERAGAGERGLRG
jgi:hypothetical protein